MTTAVGRCLGSELMAKPNSSSCRIGTPMIMPKVSRSRLSWMNSLIRMPSQRENEKRLESLFIVSPLELVRTALHQMNEGIFKRRCDLRHA